MKKTRMIAIALAVAVALMGAGYAVWTQNVVVKGTVNTGQLLMEITEDTESVIHYQVPKKNPDGTIVEDSSGNTDLAWDYISNDQTVLDAYSLAIAKKATIKGSTITFQYDNMFPSLKAYQNFTITNKGTVPVMLKNVAFTKKTGKLKNSEYMKAFVDIRTTETLYYCYTPFKDLVIDKNYVAEDDDLKNLVIPVNGSVTLRIGAYLDPDAPNDITETKGGFYKFNIEFVQANLQEYPNEIK